MISYIVQRRENIVLKRKTGQKKILLKGRSSVSAQEQLIITVGIKIITKSHTDLYFKNILIMIIFFNFIKMLNL